MEEAALAILGDLVDTPIDRTYLLLQAYSQSPLNPAFFNIDHPILYGLLKINSSYSDDDLLHIIHDLIWKVGEYAQIRRTQRRAAEVRR